MSIPLNKADLANVRNSIRALRSCQKLLKYVGFDYSILPAVCLHAGKAISEIEMLAIDLEGLLPKTGEGRPSK